MRSSVALSRASRRRLSIPASGTAQRKPVFMEDESAVFRARAGTR